MARMLYSETFLDDVETIYSPRVMQHLRMVLQMIETFPRSGSSDVPASIQSRFGGEVRKCAIAPYDLIYTYQAEDDVVRVRGLVPQRSMH